MRIVQMVDALDYGDGVSNDIINLHKLMDGMGVNNCIYSKWENEKVTQYTHGIDTYIPQKSDCILYHYSGKSAIIDNVLGFGRPVILRYHNITPPVFFRESNPDLAERCKEGIDQIQAYIHQFHRFCSVSQFNSNDLTRYGANPNHIDVLPVAINLSQFQSKEADPHIVTEMKKHSSIVFVGRIAKNKCIEDILDVFDNYYRYYDNEAYLYLVGNMQQNESYTQFIQMKIKGMISKEHIQLTGKVDEKLLYSYYKGASVFLCMSEHEGFCIPLIEAMAFEVPVIAYDAGAVADTMGGSGVLITKKAIPVVAGLLDEVIRNDSLRSRIISKQNNHLQEYSTPMMQKKLADLIAVWDKSQIK